MFSDEIIVNFKHSGECEIDLERVKKEWHDKASVYRWDKYDPVLNMTISTFRLIEKDPKGHNGMSLKLTISEKDAWKLINDLGLVPRKHHLIASATFYEKPL